MPQPERDEGANGVVQLLAASANANFADKIAKALLRAGYRLDPGEFDPARIDAVVVLWTGVALDKPALIDVARQAWKARRLTPVSVGRVEPPFGERDAAPMDLAGWRGDDGDPRWRFVLSDIEALKARAGLDAPVADEQARPPKPPVVPARPQVDVEPPRLLDDQLTDENAQPHHPARALWRNRVAPAAPMLAGGIGALAVAAGVSFMAGSLRSRPSPIDDVAEMAVAAEEEIAAPRANLALVRLAPGIPPPEAMTSTPEASAAPSPDEDDIDAPPLDVRALSAPQSGMRENEDDEAAGDPAPEAFASLAVPSLKPEPPEIEAPLAANLTQAALVQLASAVEAAARSGDEAGGEGEAYRGDYFSDCEECPDMALLAGGVFMMGARAGEQDRQPEEAPQRRIDIGYRFAIAARETTFDQWSLCVTDGGCRSYFPDDAGWGGGDRPVINVSYEDASAYARWLSAKTGYHYRLPSEAEWEFAARAGTPGATHLGDHLSAADANFDGRHPYGAEATIFRGRTAPAAQFAGNAFGLHDMHGNVREWTLDCWNASHNGGPATGAARIDGDCSRRVVKGGAWNSPAQRLRSAARRGLDAERRGPETGFRVVRVFD